MPKLPDPTLFPQSPSGELPSGTIIPDSYAAGVAREGPPLERPQSVNVETRTSERGRARQDPAGAAGPAADIKPSPFRFLGPILIAIFLALLGFLATRFVILPRLRPPTITLTYWGLWEPETVVKPAIDKYESTHPNIKINYQMQNKQEYRERLQSALARGEGPDIFRLHNSWMPMLGDELAPAPAEILSFDDFSRTFYPAAVTDLVRQNAPVAVPLMADGLGLFVNNDLMAATTSAESASGGIPTNWDDFRKVAFALTVRDDRGNIVRSGAAMGTTNNITHWPDILAILMLQNSVDLKNPAAAVDAQGRNLGADALRYFTIFTKQDRIWDESLPQDITAFATAKVAMILAPSWQVHEVLAQNSKLDFSVHPIPQLTSQRQINWASYWADGVSRHGKSQKQSWEFLKYLSSPEALQLMYTEAAKIRAFGEPYPRRDLADTLKTAKYVAPFITQSETAKSWFMNSRTFDNGLNDEIISYYNDAINSIHQKKAEPEQAISTVAKGVEQVLTKYGVK